ncbi:MAG: hypothetical protein ACE5G2_13620 [Candidatus Krumholzibacteriia bacterium]
MNSRSHATGRARCLRGAATPLLLMALLLPWRASAQHGGTTPLSFGHLGIRLDTRFDYLNRENEAPDERSSYWKRSWTRGITLGQSGFVYHPRFLRFTLEGRLASTAFDRSQGRRTADLSRDLHFDTYQVTARALPMHSWTGFLSMRRLRTRVRARSLGDQDHIRNTRVVQLRWRRRSWPLQMQWNRERYEALGSLNALEKRADFGAETSNVTRHTSARLSYGRSSFESLTSNLESRTQRLDAVYNVRGGRTLWNSSFGWLSQDLQSRLETLRANARLSHIIFSSLEAQTELEYQRFGLPDESTHRRQATVSMRHQLYESLESRAAARVLREDLEDGRIDRREWELDLDYRKRTPAGIFTYGLDLTEVRQNTDLGVTDQRVTLLEMQFSSEDLLILPELDVDPASITMLDSLGQVPFAAGRDYHVLVQGRQTVLVREPSGHIAPRSRVRLSYRYRVQESGRGGRREIAQRTSLLFPFRLRPYYSWGRTHPRRTSGLVTTGAASGRFWRGGVAYGHHSLSADWSREDRRQQDIRTERQIGSVTLRHSARRTLRVAATAAFGWTRFNEGKRLEFWNAHGTLMHFERGGSELQVRVGVSRQDLENGPQHAWDLTALLRRSFGANLVEVELSTAHSEGPVLGILDDRIVRIGLERRLR